MPSLDQTRSTQDADRSKRGDLHVRQRGSPIPAANAMAPLITEQGAVAQAPSTTDVLGLQRMIGNQAVSRMLSGAAPRPGLRAARLSRATLQRRLELGGTRRATPADVRADLGGDFDAMRDTVEALIGLPVVVKLPTADALRDVDAFWTNRTAPYPVRPSRAPREATLAILQLLSHGAWTHTDTTGTSMARIFAAFDTPEIRTNLATLGDFLRANPNVVTNLTAAGVGWELMSTHSQLKDFGGAAVIKDRIHIDTATLADADDPEGFKKMAIHEAGHATFQRILITGEGWTEKANRGTEQPDERALDADGRKFYNAWLVLRQQPKHFFVTDMPGTKSYAKGLGRKNYLAEQFTEFCADSFMHMALRKSQLARHVQMLPNWPGLADVKLAWQDALSVLTKYEPAILAGQARARPDEAKVRDRAYERYQRSGGGDRSHEETEANYYEALRQVGIEERAYLIWKLRRGDPVTNYYLAERQIAEER